MLTAHIKKSQTPPKHYQIINLLDHSISIYYLKSENQGEPVHILTIPPEPNKYSGVGVRVPYKSLKQATFIFEDGSRVPYTVNFYDDPKLPPIEAGVFYIVSWMVAKHFPERNDLLFPSGNVNDASGKKIGCLSLANYRRNNGLLSL